MDRNARFGKRWGRVGAVAGWAALQVLLVGLAPAPAQRAPGSAKGRIHELVVTSAHALGGAEGGPSGSKVELANPVGVKADSQGGLLIADTGNNRVLRLDARGHLAQVFGADGPGQLRLPADMVAGADGKLYVADTMNHRIVVFGADGRFVTAWGDGRFHAPHGIAQGPDGNLYVADTLAHRVVVLKTDGSEVAAWGEAGDGPGQMRFPHGITVGADGHVYVADFLNNRVQELSEDGRFVRSWGELGDAPGQFHNPWGVALDAAGNLWVVDMSNARVQRLGRDGSVAVFGRPGRLSAERPQGSGFSNPTALALEETGAAGKGPIRVYVADSGNLSIAVLQVSPGQTRVASAPAPGKAPAVKTLDLVPARRVSKLQAKPMKGAASEPKGSAERGMTGEGTAAPKDGALDYPFSARRGPDGRTYVADTGNHRIVVLDPEGEMVAAWGGSGSERGQLNLPSDLAFDADGNVYVADTMNDRVQKFSPDGKVLAVFGGPEQLKAPYGLVVGGDGSVYVSDTLRHRIVKFDGGGKVVKTWGGYGAGPDQLAFPHGLALAGDTLYVADFMNHRVASFTADGRPLGRWGSLGDAPGQLHHPWGVSVGPDGDVWVGDMTNGRNPALPCRRQAGGGLRQPGARARPVRSPEDRRRLVRRSGGQQSGGSRGGLPPRRRRSQARQEALSRDPGPRPATVARAAVAVRPVESCVSVRSGDQTGALAEVDRRRSRHRDRGLHGVRRDAGADGRRLPDTPRGSPRRPARSLVRHGRAGGSRAPLDGGQIGFPDPRDRLVVGRGRVRDGPGVGRVGADGPQRSEPLVPAVRHAAGARRARPAPGGPPARTLDSNVRISRLDRWLWWGR